MNSIPNISLSTQCLESFLSSDMDEDERTELLYLIFQEKGHPDDLANLLKQPSSPLSDLFKQLGLICSETYDVSQADEQDIEKLRTLKRSIEEPLQRPPDTSEMAWKRFVSQVSALKNRIDILSRSPYLHLVQQCVNRALSQFSEGEPLISIRITPAACRGDNTHTFTTQKSLVHYFCSVIAEHKCLDSGNADFELQTVVKLAQREITFKRRFQLFLY